MCGNEAQAHKKNHEFTQEDWERVQEKFSEFGAKFNARMKDAGVWGDKANQRAISLTLPNEHKFSLNFGHLIIGGVVLLLLPKLLLLGGLIAAAVYFGNGGGDPRKRHDNEKPKNKLKTDDAEFEVYNV